MSGDRLYELAGAVAIALGQMAATMRFAPKFEGNSLDERALEYARSAMTVVGDGMCPVVALAAGEWFRDFGTEFPTASEFSERCRKIEKDRWHYVTAQVPGLPDVVARKVLKGTPAHEIERVQRELEGRAAQLALAVPEKPESEGDGYQRYLEAGRNVKAKIMRPSNSSVRKMQEENLDEKKRLMRAKLEESEVKE